MYISDLWDMISEKEKYKDIMCESKGTRRQMTIPPWGFSQGGCGRMVRKGEESAAQKNLGSWLSQMARVREGPGLGGVCGWVFFWRHTSKSLESATNVGKRYQPR